MAASLLNAMGMPELISRDHRDYETLALALALDGERLASMRKRIAEHRISYPLFDTARFTRHVESAYVAMLKRQRAGLPPAPILLDT